MANFFFLFPRPNFVSAASTLDAAAAAGALPGAAQGAPSPLPAARADGARGSHGQGCSSPSGKRQRADVALHPEMMPVLCSICLLGPMAALLGFLALQGFTSALYVLPLLCRKKKFFSERGAGLAPGCATSLAKGVGDNPPPSLRVSILRNLSGCQKLSSFFTCWSFINSRAAIPRQASQGWENCSVRTQRTIWGIPWDPALAPVLPAAVRTACLLRDEEKRDPAFPFVPLNAGDLSHPGFS